MAEDLEDDDSPSPRPSPLKARGSKIVPVAGRPKGGAIKPRHDGFTPAKQRKFFKALKKSGCIKDGCRVAGISKTTVDRWRNKDAVFDGKVEAALAIASDELDMIAWQRATQGCEEKVYRNGELVSVRVKPSDSILRLLMQGANPEKYGRTGQIPKPKDKELLKRLKREAKREARAAYEAGNIEETRATLAELIAMARQRSEGEKLAQGWSPGPDGRLVVPPGWRMVRTVPLLPPPARREG